MKHGPDTWTDAVVVSGVAYQFATAPVRRNGTQLWTASLGLAERVSALDLQGTSIELGCGHGLVGMIAGATLVDNDPETIVNTRETLRLNASQCRLIEASWGDITEPFDNVFGSEILYRMYQPASIAEFLARCWTGLGVCLFAVSDTRDISLFANRLSELAMHCSSEPATYHGFQYTLVSVTGGGNA